MKFLVDNQLPPALARFIVSEFSAEALHVSDVGLKDASDAEIWRFASSNDLILISKDDDFTRLFLVSDTCRLVWIRVGNCRRRELLDVFRRVWRSMVDRLEAGDRFVEVR